MHSRVSEKETVGMDLIDAVRKGDLQETTRLIYGRRYSLDGSEGYNLLMITLENNNSAIAKLLVTKGCLVRRCSGPINDTPLHLAVRNGDLEIVSLLLDQGASSNEKNQADETPIGIAVQMGCLQIVEPILKHFRPTLQEYFDFLHTVVSNEMKTCKINFDKIVNLLLEKLVGEIANIKHHPTPLHMATKYASKDVVSFLLQHRYQVDGQDDAGNTSLHYAVERGDLTIVEAVLRFHPDITNPSNEICLKTAVCSNGRDFDKIVLALSHYGFTITPENAKDLQFLHGAVEKGNYSMVSNLLENGADPNAVCERRPQFNSSSFEILSSLHMAVKNKHERVAELLINNKANVNVQGRSRIPPIFYSVVNDDLTMTKLLLNNGASLHYTTLYDFRDTISHDLKDRWRGIYSQLLIRESADLDLCSHTGLTTLHISVMKGSEKMVALLLRHDANVNVADGKGITPLHICAEEGNLEISTLLLDNGADVNAKEVNGNASLHLAVIGGHSAVVNLLLEKGTQVNSEGRDGKTPIHLAAGRYDSLKCNAKVSSIYLQSVNIPSETGNVELNTFRRRGSDVDASTETPNASVRGSESLIAVLLRHNASVNSTDQNGVTPLHISAQKGNLELSTLLLAKGSNVNAKEDKRNETPLHMAVIAAHIEIIKLLLESGADVNSMGSFGGGPLHFAAEIDSLECSTKSGVIDELHTSIRKASEPMIYVLLRYNANVNLANMSGVTLLHISVENGNLELSTLLLNMGADVNAENQNGDNALLLAIASGNEKIVRLLLERGAHVNRKGKYQKYPLQWAAEQNNTEIVDALLEFGAEVNSRCADGQTALHFSAQLGCIKTVTTLIEYGADVNITGDRRRHTPLDYAEREVCFRPRPYHPCEGIVHYLNRHHVKMEVAGLVATGFWPSICEREEGLEDFHSECQLEFIRTKSAFIEDTNVSYYDILRKDTRSVAKYMKNPSVMLAAESENYRKTFPLYASIIKSQFRKGWKSVKLFESASQVLYRLSGLPDVCIQQIVDRLSVDDLKVLMEV